MNYTVKEVASKLKISEGTVYNLIKANRLKKIDGLGSVIRISSKELKNIDLGKNFFTFDSEKIELLETSLGKIRRIKEDKYYVLQDIVKALGVSDSYVIAKAIANEHIKKISTEEAKELGLFSNQFGILLMKGYGLLEYAPKSRRRAIVDKLIKELKISLEEEHKPAELKTELSEVLNSQTSSSDMRILEQRKILGKNFTMYGTPENPLFLAKDVAERIEHSNSRAMLQSVDESEKVVKNVYTLGGMQEAWFLTEDGLYEVLMQSRKPIAKEFKKQVKVILKQIRSTGGYVANAVKFMDNYFSSFSEETRHNMIAELQTKNKALLIEKEKITMELTDNLMIIAKIDDSLKTRKEE